MTSDTTRARTPTTKTASAFLLPGGDVHQQTSIVQIGHGDFLVCHAMPSTVTTDAFNCGLANADGPHCPQSTSITIDQASIQKDIMVSLTHLQCPRAARAQFGKHEWFALARVGKTTCRKPNKFLQTYVKVKKMKGRLFPPSLVLRFWSAWSRPEGPAPKELKCTTLRTKREVSGSAWWQSFYRDMQGPQNRTSVCIRNLGTAICPE